MYSIGGEHRLYYQVDGPEEAPVIILLHHGLGSSYSWKDQIPAFVEAGYRVIAYDRWGYGASDPRPKLSLPYFEEDLEDLRSIMDQTDVQRASLVGHSDGGTLSLYFAAENPDRVESLVIVAAHIYVEPKMLPGIKGLRAAFEQEHRFQEGMRRIHGEKAENVFWNWYEGWVNDRSLAWDMRPTLGKISCPVLVTQGLEDEHATPLHAEDMANALPKAELWLAPGAGHMLPQEISAEFNRRVLGFLGETRANIEKD